jgi:hydrogenase nickel incorporation protein HypB
MTRVGVRERILAENDREAERLRQGFEDSGTLAVNLISSPGSGKTALLEATARLVDGRLRLASIVGDIATERDAERLRAAGIPARQILTGGACHLDAAQVRAALAGAGFGSVDLLFIENVGNLVCPASYDLGEDFKVALLSVAEGDDKPFKYPAIFSRADVTVITKVDLLPHVRFDLGAVRGQLAALRPGGRLLLTSSRTGDGVADWCRLLQERLLAKASSFAFVS